MNIFFLDKDPTLAAQFMVDRHVNKMVLESVQMLANCYSLEQLAQSDCPRTQSGNPRKHSYFNHPCSIWVRKSLDNFNWLLNHAEALECERLFRDFNPHFCAPFITWCAINKPDLPTLGFTPPAQAFGKDNESLKCEDPVIAYRSYYTEVKAHQQTLPKVWTNRSVPVWF